VKAFLWLISFFGIALISSSSWAQSYIQQERDRQDLSYHLYKINKQIYTGKLNVEQELERLQADTSSIPNSGQTFILNSIASKGQRHLISLRLRGIRYQNVAPKVKLYINGKVVKTFSVNNQTEYKFYNFISPRSQSISSVYVRYTNDSGDRDLFVDSVRVDGYHYDPKNAQYDRWGLDNKSVIQGQREMSWTGFLIFNINSMKKLKLQRVSQMEFAKFSFRIRGRAYNKSFPNMRLLVNNQEQSVVRVSHSGFKDKNGILAYQNSDELQLGVRLWNADSTRDLWIKDYRFNGQKISNTSGAYDRNAHDGADIVASREAMFWKGTQTFSVPRPLSWSLYRFLRKYDRPSGRLVRSCPVEQGPGRNFNLWENSIVDLTRLKNNYGDDLSGSTYNCRTDQIAPFKVDPPRDNTASAFMEPLKTHLYRLSTITEDYARSSKLRPQIANCALDWIHTWAKAGIFTEKAGVYSEGGEYNTRQGDYERVFYVSSFVQAYGIIMNDKNLNPAKKAKVVNWMKKVRAQVRSFINIRINKDRDLNNIINWSGMTLMSLGLVLDNQSDIHRAIKIFDIGLNEIRADGYLPRELQRGSRSFTYHNYALRPLIFSAELAHSYGYDLYGRKNGRLHLLVDRVASSFINFNSFLNSQEQSFDSTPEAHIVNNSRAMDWMEIYHSRFGDDRIRDILIAARSENNGFLKTSTRTHGNATIMYGVKCL